MCSDNSIRLKLSKMIKRVRKTSGYTQKALSEITKIQYKYLQKIEGNNPPNISIETLERLSDALNVSPSQLLNFE